MASRAARDARISRRRGFTITEMLVVMALMAIILALFVSRIAGPAMKSAQVKRTRQTFDVIEGAVAAYERVNRGVPLDKRYRVYETFGEATVDYIWDFEEDVVGVHFLHYPWTAQLYPLPSPWPPVTPPPFPTPPQPAVVNHAFEANEVVLYLLSSTVAGGPFIPPEKLANIAAHCDAEGNLLNRDAGYLNLFVDAWGTPLAVSTWPRSPGPNGTEEPPGDAGSDDVGNWWHLNPSKKVFVASAGPDKLWNTDDDFSNTEVTQYQWGGALNVISYYSWSGQTATKW